MGIPPPMFGDGSGSGNGALPRNKRRFRRLYQGCTTPEPPPDYAHLQRVLNELVGRLNALEGRGLGRSNDARYLREEIDKLKRRLQ